MNSMNYRIVIPARAGSKGFPRKNLKLFTYTAGRIPGDMSEKVDVLTDDPDVSKKAKIWGFNAIDRPESVSNDTASTKSLIEWYIDNHLKSDDILIVLYLTYPERTWTLVEQAISLFEEKGSTSLLCRKDPPTSPFLILKEEEDMRGSQLFYHNLYRRQDYPKCFEISHFICIVDPKTINKLNDNLYNTDTIFMEIGDNIVDVDYEKDLGNIDGLH